MELSAVGIPAADFFLLRQKTTFCRNIIISPCWCDIVISVIEMHQLAEKIAEWCVARGWIPARQKAWCTYAVERKLLFFCFFLLLTPISILLHIIPEMIIFSISFYILRRRFGGWHAPVAWMCQLISVLLVLMVCCVLGPIFMEIPVFSLCCINLSVLGIGVLQQPIYPLQLHFDVQIKQENNRKKNKVIFAIIALQLLSLHVNKTFVVYSMMAVFVGIISVYIESFHQHIKKEIYYEQIGKSRR